jgi:hypothetical protein
MKNLRLITLLAFAICYTSLCVSCSGNRSKDYESSDKVNGSSGAGYKLSDSEKANGPQAAGNTYDTLTEGKVNAGSSGANQSGNPDAK